MTRKYRLIVAVCTVFFPFVPAAEGADHWYFAGRGGYVTNSGFGVAGAIGRLWRWPANSAADIRGELEIAFRRNETNDEAIGYVSTLAEMANFYFDFRTTMHELSPYIGAGIGVLTADNGKGTDHVLGYQGMVGLRYKVGRRTSLTGEYRYLAAPNVGLKDDAGSSVSFNYRSHNLFLGVAISF